MAAHYRLSLCQTVLPALFFCLTETLPAYAGSFRLTPMLVEVPSDSTIATYTLRNTGVRPLNIQVNAQHWKQTANKDQFSAAKRLLIVPEILTVAPGQTQLVRIALRGSRPDGELDYRLHFDEIPPPSAKGFTGVQISLNMNVPLFFAPRIVTRDIRPRLSRALAGAAVIVTITNAGSRFLRLSRLALETPAGKPLGKLDGPRYVLPGATRHWKIRLNKTLTAKGRGSRYRLEIVADGREKGYSLALH